MDAKKYGLAAAQFPVRHYLSCATTEMPPEQEKGRPGHSLTASQFDGEAMDKPEGGHLVYPRLLEGSEAGKARFGVVDVTMRGDST